MVIMGIKNENNFKFINLIKINTHLNEYLCIMYKHILNLHKHDSAIWNDNGRREHRKSNETDKEWYPYKSPTNGRDNRLY